MLKRALPLRHGCCVLPSKRQELAKRLSGFSACRAVKARWSFDAKFGHKTEALRMLQEWAKRISTLSSSFPADSVQISHGAIGVPESRIELELEFEDLNGVESFWASIPTDYHREWTLQMKTFIVDGTPQWTVQHIASARSEDTAPEQRQPATGQAPGAASRDLTLREMEEQAVLLDGVDSAKCLDWKGEVMKINPGDKLPFKFH